MKNPFEMVQRSPDIGTAGGAVADNEVLDTTTQLIENQEGGEEEKTFPELATIDSLSYELGGLYMRQFDGFNKYVDPISYFRKKNQVDTGIATISNSSTRLIEALENEDSRSQALESLSNILHLQYAGDLLEKQKDLLRKTTEPLIQKALPTIQEIIVSGDTDNLSTSFRLLRDILSSEETEQKKHIEKGDSSPLEVKGPSSEILDFLRKNKVLIQGSISEAINIAQKDSNYFKSYEQYIELCERYFPEDVSSLNEILVSGIDKNVDLTQTLTRRLLRKEGLEDNLVQKYFSSINYSPEEAAALVESWNLEGPILERNETYSSNFDAIRKLTKENRNIPSTLTADFGIRCFDRYFPEQLIKQFENKDSTKSFGIICTAVSDWNGSQGNRQLQVKEICSEVESAGFDTRIIEASSKIDFAKRLLTLRKKYDQKMKFLYFRGHGNKNGIRFGDHNKLKSADFEKDDVATPGVKKIAEFFDADAQIILSSCRTGYKKGLAEVLSDTLNMTTFASTKKSSGFSYLKAKKNESGSNVEFDIVFGGDSDEKSTIKYN